MAKPIGVGVGVFVINGSKFLMGRRKSPHGHNSWSVPGGYVEYGESFEEAAKREVKEETGLTITEVQVVAVTNNIFRSEDKHTITIWLVSVLKSGTPTVLEPDKFIDHGWYDFDTLPARLFLPFKELLKSQFIVDIKNRLSKGSSL